MVKVGLLVEPGFHPHRLEDRRLEVERQPEE